MPIPAMAVGPPVPPARPAFPARSRTPVNFGQRPMLVFWETTRACLLACQALPGQCDQGAAAW